MFYLLGKEKFLNWLAVFVLALLIPLYGILFLGKKIEISAVQGGNPGSVKVVNDCSHVEDNAFNEGEIVKGRYDNFQTNSDYRWTIKKVDNPEKDTQVNSGSFSLGGTDSDCLTIWDPAACIGNDEHSEFKWEVERRETNCTCRGKDAEKCEAPPASHPECWETNWPKVDSDNFFVNCENEIPVCEKESWTCEECQTLIDETDICYQSFVNYCGLNFGCRLSGSDLSKKQNFSIVSACFAIGSQTWICEDDCQEPCPSEEDCPVECHVDSIFVNDGQCGQKECLANAPAAEACPTECDYPGGLVSNGECGFTECPATEPCPTECPVKEECPIECHVDPIEVEDGQCGKTVCPGNAPTEEECPAECDYPGGTVSDGQCGEKQCPATESCPVSTVPTNTPVPTPTPKEEESTSTPEELVPTLTPTPTEAGESEEEEEEESGGESGGGETGGGGVGGGPTSAPLAVATVSQVLGVVDNYNPLIEGIKKSFGKVLGATTDLPGTGSEEEAGEEKLPSGNKLKEKVKLAIPDLGIETLIYQGEMLGDQFLIGDQEILEIDFQGRKIIYSHNDTGSFGQLNHLSRGDLIIREEDGNLVEYQVAFVGWATSGYWETINQSQEDSLVLITCNQYQPNLRIIVRAEKTEK